MKLITAVFFALLTIPALGASLPSPCKVLGDPERARLTEYVKKKYKQPPAASLRVSEESLVGATCFQKLVFRSSDPKGSFRMELYLSPDFRFLTRELLDSNVDPLVEERQKQKALEAGLVNGNFPSLGPRDARISITVFSDFQCPYCAKMADMLTKNILPAERKNVRLVFRHFPLSGHKWALAAAQAAACAQEQGDNFFWSLHDFIFEQQQEFTPDNLVARLTEQSKQFRRFDASRFASCVASNKTAAKVDQDLAFGNRNGVSGTPTLFINGHRVDTVAAPEQIRTLIREAGR